MKKLTFLLLLPCLLLVAAVQAQITVSGYLTSSVDGSPVANQQVNAIAGAGTINFVTGSAVSDANGFYTISLNASAALNTVTVSTQTNCNPASATEFLNLPLTTLQLTANFVICPAVPTCQLSIVATPTSATGVYQFTAVFSANVDPTGATYLWIFGDGTSSTAAAPTHAFTSSGEFVVTLTASTASGCTVVSTTVVNVVLAPVDCTVSISAIPTSAPQSYQFLPVFATAAGPGGVTFLWTFGDGTSSTEATPTHYFAAAGLYVVTLTVTTASGCTSTATFPLDVTIPPPPACVVLITYAESAAGFVFTANSNPGTPPLSGTFVWDFGDGSPTVTTTSPSVTHAFATTGAFTVTLTAYANGCVATTTVVVLAFNNPVGEFAYGCQALFHTDLASANPADPLTVAFVDASLGAANKWTWDFGDGQTSTTQNPSHTFAAEGDYVVQLSTESISGCESSTHFVVHAGANPPFVQEPDCQALFVPLPGTTDGTSLLCVDLSKAPQGIQTWNWDFGDGQTSTEQYPHHTYAAAGAYDVSLQITGPGCNSVLKMEIESESPWGFNPGYLSVAGGTSSTNTVVAFDAVRLFPNPVSSTLTAVFAAKSAETYELRVSDLTGRLWSSARQQAAVGTNTVQADLTTCPAGVYLVELRTAQSLQVFRVVKQ